MSYNSALVLACLTLLSIAAPAQDRWVTLAGSDDVLTIPDGQTALLMAVPNMEADFVYQKQGGKDVRFNLGGTLRPDGNRGQVSQASPMPLVGPATVRMLNEVVVGLKLVSTQIDSNTGSDKIKASNTVVIPSDAEGPVQVILESSMDLITWTGAEPGTYGASATNRFFRLRALAE